MVKQMDVNALEDAVVIGKIVISETKEGLKSLIQEIEKPSCQVDSSIIIRLREITSILDTYCVAV